MFEQKWKINQILSSWEPATGEVKLCAGKTVCVTETKIKLSSASYLCLIENFYRGEELIIKQA